CSGELTVISCWEYEFEDYLRHNVWVKVKEDELQKIMTDEERQYRVALDNLIRQSNIGGNIQVHHVKGRPDQIIPRYIEEMNIDILVMGTVARTGIQGFIIGNTAENIMQNIGGSLVALKPQGFVSPVKPY